MKTYSVWSKRLVDRLRAILPRLKDHIWYAGDEGTHTIKVKPVLFHLPCVDATHFKVHQISQYTDLLFPTIFVVGMKLEDGQCDSVVSYNWPTRDTLQDNTTLAHYGVRLRSRLVYCY